MIDLHLHTTASDGTLEPEMLVRRVAAAGVSIMSVTDHDSMAAVPAAAEAAARHGLRFVPGIEITAVEEGDVHVLGYWLDSASPALVDLLRMLRAERLARAREIARKLAAVGAAVDIEPLVAVARRAGRSIGRPQIASALVAAARVATVTEAFDRYLAEGKPAYVPHRGVPPADVVRVIVGAGGIASLAHPGLLGRDGLIRSLVSAGLAAVEAYHSEHTPEMRQRYVEVAREYGLAVTGGSDYHGEGMKRAERLGTIGLPAEHFADLAQRAGRSTDFQPPWPAPASSPS